MADLHIHPEIDARMGILRTSVKRLEGRDRGPGRTGPPAIPPSRAIHDNGLTHDETGQMGTVNMRAEAGQKIRQHGNNVYVSSGTLAAYRGSPDHRRIAAPAVSTQARGAFHDEGERCLLTGDPGSWSSFRPPWA